MLAEMFMIWLEMAARTTEPKPTDRCVPFDKATFTGFKAQRVKPRQHVAE
jgi:hypothetical protein